MNGVDPSDELRAELEKWVRTEIGPIAKPDLIQWAPGMPKTRSGKILRKTMRQMADGQEAPVPSTIEDATVLDALAKILGGESTSQG